MLNVGVFMEVIRNINLFWNFNYIRFRLFDDTVVEEGECNGNQSDKADTVNNPVR